MSRTSICADGAPAAIGPYSHAVLAGDTLYVSGQLGADPETGALPTALEEQAERALGNLASVLAEAGMTLANVVKTTVFLADMKDFGTVNEIYGRVFEENRPKEEYAAAVYFDLAQSAQPAGFPARSCVQAAALPKGARVEIEAIAVR